MAKQKKYVYSFGGGKAEGRAEMKELLGGKGANLAEMANLKIPVPAGFTITTEVCTYYYQNKKKYPAELKPAVKEAMKKVEAVMKSKIRRPGEPPAGFRALRRPQLHAGHDGDRAERRPYQQKPFRSGEKTNNERFVYDAYRRLIMIIPTWLWKKRRAYEPAEGKGIRGSWNLPCRLSRTPRANTRIQT
jgi:pyruvate,orthophosphate dikinase